MLTRKGKETQCSVQAAALMVKLQMRIVSVVLSGWKGFGIFLLVLSVISIVTGVWDIWIYRRNLPPTAKHSQLADSTPKLIRQDELRFPSSDSITEQSTRHLNERQM